MRMQFGTNAFERARGDLPPLPLINMTLEQAPTEATQIALQSRPGLSDRNRTVGADVTAIYRADGVLDGAELAVSGGALYADGVQVGTLDGSGPVSIAANELGAFITCGASLWHYDGVTLSALTFPDDASVVKVIAGASRIWAIRADTGRLFWTPALDETFDGLDFATAESLPDRLLDALWIDDAAVLFGSETVEFWPNTSDDPPIAPLEGRVFSRGVKATGCAVQWGETFAWVGNDNVVYTNGDSPQPLSMPGMQALIEASTECSLFTFILEGQDFLALRIDGRTFVMGNRNRAWSEFTSYGQTNWLAKCWSNGIFGLSNGKTAEWGATWLDMGDVLERRFRGGFPLNSGGVTVANMLLRSNPGRTTYLTGEYAEPIVEMRLSRDAGTTFGSWRARSLGVLGDYRQIVRWNALGMASQPGLIAEYRMSAPIDWRVSDCVINEGWGGR